MSLTTILLVEDEPAIADTLIYALGTEGFSVHHVTLGKEAISCQTRRPYDFVILDLGLPDMTGFDVLRAFRSMPEGQGVPVLFLTARAGEIDRILGLELGADDYVTKPFSPREIVARVRAILRRGQRVQEKPQEILAEAIWRQDPNARSISFYGEPLDLTRYEYDLLSLLLSAPERVFTRDQIMSTVWVNAPETDDRSIDTHIKTLRSKLRAIRAEEEVIVTHRGIGYALNRPKSAST